MNDKFNDNDNLNETNNLNNQKNIVRSKDKSNKDKTISNRIQSDSKVLTKNEDKNLSNKSFNDSDFSSNYNANNSDIKSETEAKTNTTTNKEDSNNSLLITENKLNLNYFDLNKEFDNISYSPNNKNINTIVLKSKYNKIDENSKLGISILSLTQNTNLGKDFVIAGYYKVNNGELYNLELGIEYNSVMLQTLSNNNSNFINGPGIGLRFQSNKVLQSLIGEEFSEILNAYSMASIGSTTPGQYYKLSAGMQIKLFEVSNINFELMTGYEYFSLIQSNSTFISNRSGIVSGFVIKF
jgi:hypothetical protein